jgi:hypothetical protein
MLLFLHLAYAKDMLGASIFKQVFLEGITPQGVENSKSVH